MRILIVGAGIGGLTAALALLRDGHDVEVYEQAAQLAELGAGVQISANGARVLFALGLEDALRRVWCEPAGKEIRLWTTGETWKLFDLGTQSVARYGAPYFMIHRADMHQVLIDAVRARKPDAIRLNARVVSFANARNGLIHNTRVRAVTISPRLRLGGGGSRSACNSGPPNAAKVLPLPVGVTSRPSRPAR